MLGLQIEIQPAEAKITSCSSIQVSVVSFLVLLFAASGLFFQLTDLSLALQATGAFTILLVGFNYIAQIFLLGNVGCQVSAELRGSRLQGKSGASQTELGI